MPNPRGGAAIASLGGQVYVATGFDVSGVTTEVDVFDTASNTWSLAAPIPGGVDYAAAAVANGNLYVIGGCAADGDCVSGLTNSNQVYSATNSSWTMQAPMPTARFEAAADEVNGLVYVAGGSGICGPCTGSDVLEVFDPASGTWDTTRASLPQPTAFARGVTVGGLFYVLAYLADGSDGLFSFDPTKNAWATLSSPPNPHNEFALAQVNGVLYVISGQIAGNATTEVDSYQPSCDLWATVASIPTSRYAAAAAAVNGIIYVPGSGAGNTPISTLEAYAP
jgi:N-acetylneuraminic acid mutarotase